MEKVLGPIPAYYACYLLRSTVRHASLYVGSTPNPVRRLRQHNGESKGGAVRTSRDSLRPWEMTCLVSGFPSQVAALQFEWAWQNTHLTRHVSPNSRLTQAKTTVRFSPKTGRPRKRSARHPRLCLSDRLANLHQLLRSSSFERWPLKVTFYAEDVFRVWQKSITSLAENLRPDIEILLVLPQQPAAETLTNSVHGIHAIDVGYSGLKGHLEKSKDFGYAEANCACCHQRLPKDGSMTLMCPADNCHAAGHLDCFGSHFLRGENADVVPIAGTCPSCGTKLQWVDLVKEFCLRMRGGQEVDKLFKVKRARGPKRQVQMSASGPAVDAMSEDEDELPDAPLEDNWHYLSDSIDGDRGVQSFRSDPSPLTKPSKRLSPDFAPRSEPLIEDSDWDDAEVVT